DGCRGCDAGRVLAGVSQTLAFPRRCQFQDLGADDHVALCAAAPAESGATLLSAGIESGVPVRASGAGTIRRAHPDWTGNASPAAALDSSASCAIARSVPSCGVRTLQL